MRQSWGICRVAAGVALVCFFSGQIAWTGPGGPTVSFHGKFGQVEVGGPYVGAEFHDSRPLPSRISFFYPVANSIDLSTDYWKRGESRPMVVGVAANDGPRRWLGKEGWDYEVSPHRVRFVRKEEELHHSMSYEFCLNEPAMLFRLTVRNVGSRPLRLNAYTHLKGTLRTCQTYARLDSASTRASRDGSTLFVSFDEKEAAAACVLVGNAGDSPVSWTTDARELGIADSGGSVWVAGEATLRRALFSSGKEGDATVAFMYEKEVHPGDSLSIIQYIASCKQEESDSLDERLRSRWRAEVEAYDQAIRQKAYTTSMLATGDAWTDSSVAWAKGILAANAHYLDGKIVPMPCPAEYNFFFTHDLLLTDLAAVHFDPDRVRRDLQYVMSLAQEEIIPHAYYWRDNGFKTELCTPDNWNHLWFILVNGSYLRHTADTLTVSRLYSLITKSLTEILTQRRPDGLMHAFRPDWWDIGRNEGPRSFITILTIRALREYLFISSWLGRNLTALQGYEQLADEMQKALLARLWDDNLEYLVNFNGDEKDTHYYMGSLLGAAFSLLPHREAEQLMRTASRHLVAPDVGVRTVFPVDFNTDSVRAFFKLVGNEAGDPYVYANGGVWPHNNAWYILGLQATGSRNDALDFYRETMTVQGIMRSPMGHPAMYEYRFSDPSSPEYGRIDKPSFLWAGGFSLLALYRLLGVSESEWNISLGVEVPDGLRSVRYDLWFNGMQYIAQEGTGGEISSIVLDGRRVPSRVLPLRLVPGAHCEVFLGPARETYLDKVNAIVDEITVDDATRTLRVRLRSFDGHRVTARIVSPRDLTRARVDGQRVELRPAASRSSTAQAYDVRFRGTSGAQLLEVTFQGEVENR